MSAVKPAESASKPVGSAVKPAESASKPVGSAVKPAEPASKPAESASEPPCQPASPPSQPSSLSGQPSSLWNQPSARRPSQQPDAAVGDALSLPEIFLARLYGVLAHPAFTERFWRELRAPLTQDSAPFAEACEIGASLLWLHTYGERCADPAAERP